MSFYLNADLAEQRRTTLLAEADAVRLARQARPRRPRRTVFGHRRRAAAGPLLADMPARPVPSPGVAVPATRAVLGQGSHELLRPLDATDASLLADA